MAGRMLAYEEFLNYLMDNIKFFLPPEYAKAEIRMNKTVKNNGITYDGISILNEGENVSPVIYGQNIYRGYERMFARTDARSALDDTLEQCASMYLDARISMPDVNNLLDRKKVYYEVANYENNREELENYPHEVKGDLVLSYYVLVEQQVLGSAGTGKIHITNEIMSHMGLTRDELMQLAKENTPVLKPAELTDITVLLKEMMPDDMEMDMDMEIPENKYMYVLSSRDRQNGAATMFYEGIFEKYEAVIGKQFYILPSSVHEVIIVPQNGSISPDYLRTMVRDVNKSVLDWSDFLSNNVYEYNAITKDIEPAAMDVPARQKNLDM